MRKVQNYGKYWQQLLETYAIFRTYLAGQIARACSIFQVDEIIIFDESNANAENTKGEFTGVKKKGNPNQTLGRILRKSL